MDNIDFITVKYYLNKKRKFVKKNNYTELGKFLKFLSKLTYYKNKEDIKNVVLWMIQYYENKVKE